LAKGPISRQTQLNLQIESSYRGEFKHTKVVVGRVETTIRTKERHKSYFISTESDKQFDFANQLQRMKECVDKYL